MNTYWMSIGFSAVLVAAATTCGQVGHAREETVIANTSDELMTLTCAGPATASIRSDGSLDVRFSPHAPSLEALETGLKPDETYVLWIDAHEFSLVDASGTRFLDLHGIVTEQRGLTPSEVSVISLDGEGSDQDPPGSVLTISGDFVLELEPELGYGYLRIWDRDEPGVLELEFALGYEPAPGTAIPTWWPGVSFCFIRCSLFNSCAQICPIGLCAQCICNEENIAECECVNCGGGGGGFENEVQLGTTTSSEILERTGAGESDPGESGSETD
ncbi:MAG: hypothetical protein ACYSUI_21385 [Planctomycetota bacterium]|jgi:hypothetical protein